MRPGRFVRDGVTAALSPEDVIVREVNGIGKDRVDLVAILTGALARYTQKTPYEWTAKRLGEILVANIDNTIFPVGMIEILFVHFDRVTLNWKLHHL